MPQRTFILFFLITMTLNSFCQSFDEKDFIRFTNNEGLSDNYVTALQQDEQGYLWIGTDVGLNRYDGHSFKSYYQASGNIPLLSSKISRLKKFSENQIGIITRSGFQLLNTNTFSLQNYLIEDNTAFTTYRNFVWDALPLPANSLALTTTSGFYVFDKEKKIIFRHDAYGLGDMNKKYIRYGRDMFAASVKDYLVYVEVMGLKHYNANTKQFNTVSPEEKEWGFFLRPPEKNENWITKYQLNKDQYFFIHFEKDNIVWYNHATNQKVSSTLPFNCRAELSFESRITRLNDSSFLLNGGYNGFYFLKYDRPTGKVFCDGKKYLSAHKINLLFADKDGRLWAGTPQGLLQQKLKKTFLTTYSFDDSMLNDRSVGFFTGVYRYREKLYVTRYSRNSGLIIMDTSTMKIQKAFNFFNGDHKWNEIYSIQMYHPDTLWLGTNNGIIWFDTKSYQYGEVPLTVHLNPDKAEQIMLHPSNKNGEAWFTYTQNGISGYYDIAKRNFSYFTLKTDPYLPFLQIKNLAYDAYSDVWIGGHALTRWNNQKKIFDTLITVYGGAKKFNDDILMFVADEYGSLWLHNEENGLLEYRIKGKKFIAYTTNDGLPFYEFESFSPIVNDILWIAGRSMLARFNIRSKQSIVFDRYDGLPLHKPTTRNMYYDQSAGYFYLLCKNDIVKFPIQTGAVTDPVSGLLIENLKINSNRILFQPEENLRLKSKENNLEIHFSVIDFESGNDYIFAYRLKDDQPWVSLNTQRNITLTGLPAGKYSIKIKATTKSGIEKTSEFLFIIAPPFWKTGWFITIVGFILAGGLYFLYRSRINQVKQKANIDKQLAQTEMKALHSQMNPHFIFNCLNSIREMILNNENEQASLYLSKFARLIRITLSHSSKPFVSLEDTIDYLQRYLEMEQIRKNNFRYTFDVDENLQPNEILLPPMLIQPFIENAIWHGASPGKEMHVSIQFKRKNHELICIVEDDGVGIEASLKNKEPQLNYQSVGISNIKQRIHVLNEKYNLQSTVHIKDKSGLHLNGETGTIVTLHLTIKTSES